MKLIFLKIGKKDCHLNSHVCFETDCVEETSLHAYINSFPERVPQKCEQTFSENRISRIFIKISSKENIEQFSAIIM